MKVRSIFPGVVRQSNGQPIGADDAGGRGIKGANAAHTRLDLLHPLHIDDFKARHAVGIPLGFQCLKGFNVHLVLGHRELSDILNLDLQIPA